MTDKLEDIFINFANSEEDSLKQLGFTKDSFIEQAKQWSKTEEGKLEIQKFILDQEIKTLENEISEIDEKIFKKKESIKQIEEELEKL